MRTLAVVNQKGGVAKSTTASIIGELFQREGARVLYVDLDAQGNLSYSLGYNGGTAGSFEVLTREATAAEAVQRLPSGAALLPASSKLDTANVKITETGKEYRLREALASLQADYDLCVIDTPPSLGVVTTNALVAAEGVIIPAQADIFSLQGIRLLSETLSLVKQYCNPSLKVWGVLLTRFNRRAVISKEVEAALGSAAATALASRLFKARIRECIAIKEAQASRAGILAYAKDSNAVADYEELFKELKEVMKYE